MVWSGPSSHGADAERDAGRRAGLTYPAIVSHQRIVVPFTLLAAAEGDAVAASTPVSAGRRPRGVSRAQQQPGAPWSLAAVGRARRSRGQNIHPRRRECVRAGRDGPDNASGVEQARGPAAAGSGVISTHLRQPRHFRARW